MAGNFFSRISERFDKNTPLFILGIILFGYSLYLGVNFFLEDYSANLAFSTMIPTRKALGDLTVVSMARFIQIAPILFGFAFLRDTKQSNWGYLAMSGFFLLIDWSIGVYYRGFGLEPKWIIYAAVEDLVFFTAGSELLIMFAAGVLYTMLVPKIKGFFFSDYSPTRKDSGNSKKNANLPIMQRNLQPKTSERTSERTNKKDQIAQFIENHKKQYGSFPSTKTIEEKFSTSRGYGSDVLNTFDDYRE